MAVINTKVHYDLAFNVGNIVRRVPAYVVSLLWQANCHTVHRYAQAQASNASSSKSRQKWNIFALKTGMLSTCTRRHFNNFKSSL